LYPFIKEEKGFENVIENENRRIHYMRQAYITAAKKYAVIGNKERREIAEKAINEFFDGFEDTIKEYLDKHYPQ
jgi:uncharacterized membrane protein YebE (DUF533 family)